MILRKWAVCLLVLCSFILVSCNDLDEKTLSKIEYYLPLLDDAAQEDPIHWVINESAHDFDAHTRASTNTITINIGVLEAFQRGEVTEGQVLMVLCHEIGHLNAGNQLPSDDPYYCEDNADFYGLLLWDEFNRDNKLGLDIYEAVEIYAIMDGPDDGEHHSGAYRTKMLRDRIDYWKKHEGQIEAGG